MRVDPADRNILLGYVCQLQQHFEQRYFAPCQSKLGNVMPQELLDIQTGIVRLCNRLQDKPNSDFDLTGNESSIAKLSVHIARREVAKQQERLRESNVNAGVYRKIDDLMAPIRKFQEADWFVGNETLRIPPLTDFLTLDVAYQVLAPYLGKMPVREFDGKFGILQSQKSFLSILRYSRIEASLRNTETTVAFVDIDNFKEFNSELTETVVDREVLRPVMRLIESHCYSKGEAFQFGGDEYVLLLPNMDLSSAQRYLFRLQEKLALLKFSVTGRTITVSIGSCTFPSECYYTDQEILDFATKAKACAKQKKDCVAIFNHSDFESINISRHDLRLGAKAY